MIVGPWFSRTWLCQKPMSLSCFCIHEVDCRCFFSLYLPLIMIMGYFLCFHKNQPNSGTQLTYSILEAWGCDLCLAEELPIRTQSKQTHNCSLSFSLSLS